MKLKQQPDDFQVEEITTLTPSEGPHTLYRLEKRGWSTPDALAAVRRRWRIEPRRISYGGLKDRHAVTVQYLTIFHGPRRNLHHQDIFVQYLGHVAAPYTSRDIQANRFRLTLRDLSPEARSTAETRLSLLAREGVPNYYRRSAIRLGRRRGRRVHRASAGAGPVRGGAASGPDRALRIRSRRPEGGKTSAVGALGRLGAAQGRALPRNLIDYLRVHPSDFRGAVARLRPELRGLYLSAYQSHLWNRMLAAWLRTHIRPEQLRPVMLRLGVVPFHHNLEAEQQHELAALLLPLPSARLKLDDGDPRAELVSAILAEEGLESRQMQIKGIREMFFSKGERPALCLPAELSFAFAEDDKHRGRDKLMLGFELPRGCYATLLVKAVALEGERKKEE